MEQILTAIIERLEANKEALGLSYVDEEYGQVDFLDDETRDTYAPTFPAVLVDGSGEEWTQDGRAMQQGVATVNVNVYIDCYDDTHACSETIGKVAERMALVRSVTELLQGWEPLSTSGRLIRQRAQASTGNHGIKLYQVTFTIPVYESFSDPADATATVRLMDVRASILTND